MEQNYQVVFAGKKQVELREAKIPAPGPGQVLIKSVLTQVSTGTELTILIGEYPPGSVWANYGQYPFNAGYSNIGRVIDVGQGVNRSLIGRLVGSQTFHAHYVIGEHEALRFLPEGIKAEQAVFFTIAEIVMNGVRLAKIEPGEAVAVFGLGLLGQFTVQFCRFCGGWPVIAVDPAEFRRALARQSGANYDFDPLHTDLEAKIKDITKERMCDVAFEVTGIPSEIGRQLGLLRERGREIILSSPRGASTIDFHDLVNRPSRVIIGAHNWSHPKVETTYNQWTAARDAELFFSLLQAGIFTTAHLVSHRFKWDQAVKAYQMLMADRSKALGVLFDWDECG